jgi:hypothetical protein
MKITLWNSLNCELDGWSSPDEFAQAILCGEVELMDGDTLRVEPNQEEAERARLYAKYGDERLR